MFQFILVFFLFPAFAGKNADVTIVNTNTSQSTSQSPSQVITAPALNPSKAQKLRDARESAEVKTESLILEKMEQERLKNEQSLFDKIFGASQKPQVSSTAVSAVSTPPPSPYFASGMERVYVSAGLGMFQFQADNVNSTSTPFCFSACFVSVGGAAKKYFLFDFGFIYSRHYLQDPKDSADIRRRVEQPMFSAVLRITPFSGKIRPYAGLSGAYIRRKVDRVTPEGKRLPWEDYLQRDVGKPQWTDSFDGGVSLGADVDLGHRLGLNIDFRRHWNLDTEDTKYPAYFTYYTDDHDHRPDHIHLSEAGSVIISVSLRVYF